MWSMAKCSSRGELSWGADPGVCDATKGVSAQGWACSFAEGAAKGAAAEALSPAAVAWPCPCAGAAAAAAGGWPSTAVGDCGPDGSTADWGRVMWQGRHGLPRTPRNGLDVLCRCWVSFPK